MNVRDIPRWIWVIVGLIVGLTQGYIWSDIEPAIPNKLGQATFENLLVAPPLQGRPWLAQLSVLPPENRIYIVTGLQLRYTAGETKATYVPFFMHASVPYVPSRTPMDRRKAVAERGETVIDYLNRAIRSNSGVTYRIAWEREARATYLIWTALSVFLIGGVWPSMINVAAGRSLLARSQRWPGGAAIATGDNAPVDGPNSADASPPSPSEAAPEAPLPPDEPKVYSGEYYPVARSAASSLRKPDHDEGAAQDKK